MAFYYVYNYLYEISSLGFDVDHVSCFYELCCKVLVIAVTVWHIILLICLDLIGPCCASAYVAVLRSMNCFVVQS